MAYGGISASGISTRNPNDDYELLENIGRGTYGNVYKARKISTGELAAIKRVQLEPGDDFADIEREIMMLKDCRHPNIVAYYESYLRRGNLSICMEYCGGGSIMDIYRATGALSEKQIAFVCRETLRGLEYLHSRGKMHRDIKGANILLTEPGDVKLADFGVSAQITDTFCKRKSFIGTPFWMAPEVAAVEKKGGYNHLCDIWAVGITAIEMAELDPPMADLHPMRALFIMSKRSFKPPSLKVKELWTKDFHDFIKVTLKKDPKKRPSADMLLQHKFVSSHLSKALTLELLQRARAPPAVVMNGADADDEEENVPRRIASRPVGRDAERTRSQILLGSVNLPPPPVVTELSSEPRGAREAYARSVSEAKEEDGQRTPSFDEPWLDGATPEDSKKGLLHFIDEELRQRGHHGTLLAYEDSGYNNRETVRIGGSRPDNGEVDTMVRLEQRWAENVENRTGSGRRVRRYSSSDAPLSASSPEDEIADRTGTLTLNAQPERASSDTESDARNSRSIGKKSDEVNRPPEAPPRKRDRRKTSPSGQRDGPSKGLPPTPQVHMGAGFAKVFNCCPLKLNCATSWVHPTTRNQHILIGADEGIYTLDLAELHEGAMNLLTPRKTTWMFAMKDVLMSISGKTPHLYSHDLLALHSQHSQKFSLPRPINRLPERFVPRRFAVTTKVPNTKGCMRCCVARNRFDGFWYLCGATPNEVFLMQWYEPLRKFMLLKTLDWKFPTVPRVFALVVTGDSEYAKVCVDARHRYDDTDRLDLTMIDLATPNCNTLRPEDDDMDEICDGGDTMVPLNREGGPRYVVQLSWDDSILVCFDKFVQIVDIHGRPVPRQAPADDSSGAAGESASVSRLVPKLTFNFRIDHLVCLTDSVLAFHAHGFQGRSLTTGGITQEITDDSRRFRVLGVERTIVVESRPTAERQEHTEGVNLYILTGHENTL